MVMYRSSRKNAGGGGGPAGQTEVTDIAELTAAIADAVTAGYGDIRGVPGSTFTPAATIDVSDLYDCKIDLSHCQVDASALNSIVVGNTPVFGTARGIAAVTINATTITTDADYSSDFLADRWVKITHGVYSTNISEINRVSSAGATGTSVPLKWPVAHAYDAAATMTVITAGGCGGLHFKGFNVTGYSGAVNKTFNLQGFAGLQVEDLVSHETGGFYLAGRDITIERWRGTAVQQEAIRLETATGQGFTGREIYLVGKGVLMHRLLRISSGTNTLLENCVIDGPQEQVIHGNEGCYSITARNVTARNGSHSAGNYLGFNDPTGPYGNGKLVLCDCRVDSTLTGLSTGVYATWRNSYVLP